MTTQIEITIPQGANLELLREELRIAVGEYVAGVSRTDDVYYVIVEDDAPADIADQFAAIISAHDPEQLTATQAALLATADADVRAREIPGWALWDEQQTIDYITTEVTDLASAKVVLVAMARLLVALRDAQWPALSVE